MIATAAEEASRPLYTVGEMYLTISWMRPAIRISSRLAVFLEQYAATAPNAHSCAASQPRRSTRSNSTLKPALRASSCAALQPLTRQRKAVISVRAAEVPWRDLSLPNCVTRCLTAPWL